MAKLKWDQAGERLYETGVTQCALFVSDGTGGYQKGVAWNGITGVSENPSGAESTAIYADNIKYLNLVSNGEFGATIEAYTYPDEFAECDGSAELVVGVKIGQQNRKSFGLAYKTTVGNDTEGTAHGYKLHIVYNATAAPTSKAYATVNDSPEAMTFSWEVTTTPVEVEGFKPTATVVIDSTKVEESKMAKLIDKVYGTTEVEPALPTPDEIKALLTAQPA